MISPMMPVIRTMISQSAPFIPRDSASLYTQTHSRIAMRKKTTGMMQKSPANPATSHSACNIVIKLNFLHLGYSFRLTFLIRFIVATFLEKRCLLFMFGTHCAWGGYLRHYLDLFAVFMISSFVDSCRVLWRSLKGCQGVW